MNKLIAAVAKNNLLGAYDADGIGYMPWPFLKEDLDHFKQVTMDHQMVMGSETLVSLPGMLPGREHRVLTRNQEEVLARLTNHSRKNSFLRGFDERRLNFFSSLDEALDCELPIITGGSLVYQQVMEQDIIDLFYITHVHKNYEDQLEGSSITKMPQIPCDELTPLKGFIPQHIRATADKPAYTIMAYEKQ